MVALAEALLLGVIQGITEWLPVSSSGHLAAAQVLLGIRASVFFDVMLHAATLAVVSVVFRREILSIIRALSRRDFSSPDGRMALFILAGSVPTAAIGFLFRSAFEAMFSNLFSVGLMLISTGFALFASRFSRPGGELDFRRSLLVGAAQGVAIAPGASRSGLTISAALLSGVERETAVRYSFLLMIPAVLGAMIVQAGSAEFQPGLAPVAAGMLASALVGYASLKLLIRIVVRKRFWLFSFYCWIAGAVLIALSL